MITVKAFVGALMEQIAAARTISDQASVQIAGQYLDHELLRGFPVPHMAIREMELNLNFALASKLQAASFLEDEEVRKNIAHRLRDYLATLPADRECRAYFQLDKQLQVKWKRGLDGMSQRFAKILARPSADRELVTRSLSLSVENYFHETAPVQLRLGLTSMLDKKIKSDVDSHIRGIINHYAGETVAAPGGSSDVGILLGAAELDKLDPANLQKVKITLTPADRRWVAVDQDGKKVYQLDRG